MGYCDKRPHIGTGCETPGAALAQRQHLKLLMNARVPDLVQTFAVNVSHPIGFLGHEEARIDVATPVDHQHGRREGASTARDRPLSVNQVVRNFSEKCFGVNSDSAMGRVVAKSTQGSRDCIALSRAQRKACEVFVQAGNLNLERLVGNFLDADIDSEVNECFDMG